MLLARGQWQPRQLLTRCGTVATTRIRNRTYLHLIAPNALYCLPPAGMDSHGYITDVGCALECATRDLATSCKLFAPHGTADFRHMHILRSGRVVESKRLSQRLRSLACLALVSYRWHSNLTGDRQ